MASFETYWPKLLSHEGGYVNDPNDMGGATNWGITQNTLSTYRGKPVSVEDVKKLTQTEAKAIYKKMYWDAINASLINSQEVAEILVDWKINGGLDIRVLQKIVGAKEDGKMGLDTVKAVNAKSPLSVFSPLLKYREAYYRNLVQKKPSQAKFLTGWLNRLSKLSVPAGTAIGGGIGLLAGLGFFFWYLTKSKRKRK